MFFCKDLSFTPNNNAGRDMVALMEKWRINSAIMKEITNELRCIDRAGREMVGLMEKWRKDPKEMRCINREVIVMGTISRFGMTQEMLNKKREYRKAYQLAYHVL